MHIFTSIFLGLLGYALHIKFSYISSNVFCLHSWVHCMVAPTIDLGIIHAHHASYHRCVAQYIIPSYRVVFIIHAKHPAYHGCVALI